MKTALFVDHENLSIAARNRGVGIDWYDFKEYLASDGEGRPAVGAFCYVAVDPRSPNAKDREIDRLWEDGWLVRTKTGAPAGPGRYKCNVDVEMAMDMIFFAGDVRPDIVVMVTGDQDFAPVAIKLRERGVRVEVAAFPESVSKVLLNAASGYINLEKWLEGGDEESGDGRSGERGEDSFGEDGEDAGDGDGMGDAEIGAQAGDFQTRGGRALPKSGGYGGGEDDADY